MTFYFISVQYCNPSSSCLRVVDQIFYSSICYHYCSNFCCYCCLVACRRGVRVGVLSGPGHCAKSHHHRRRNSSSLVHISQCSNSDSADANAAAADRRKSLLVQFNLPDHLSSTSNVQSSCCTSMWLFNYRIWI